MPNSIKSLTGLFEQHPQLTVITATRRLARRLLHDFNQQQAADGLKAWPTPYIMSWSAWVQREWQAVAIKGGRQDDTHSTLLSTAQSSQLWESIIEAANDDPANGLLNTQATARHAQSARQLVIDYRLDLSDKTNQSLFVYDADASRWLDWHNQYKKQLAQSNWLDTPAVTHRLIKKIIHKESSLLPGSLCFMGFDSFTPLQWQLLNHLQEKQLFVESPEHTDHQGQAALYRAKDASDEIRQAAYWARQQFEQDWQEGDQPIGVIVPKLGQQRKQVERIFREVFYPRDGLNNIGPGTHKENFHSQGMRDSSVFNISMGYSLAQEPIIEAALDILSLCHLNFNYETFSQILRSPFIKDAKENAAVRSQLDIELRKHVHAESSLYDVLISTPEDSMDGCVNGIIDIIKQLSELKSQWAGRVSAHQWVERIYQCMKLFGWPNLPASEHSHQQVMQSLDEVLFDFSRLDSVKNEMDMQEAFAAVSRMIKDKVFQPGAGEVPVQILGMLESAGINFSSLWVTDMTEQNWPQPENPSPFVPIRLQREHSMPHSSPMHEYDYARHQTQRLIHAAEQIIFSYPQQSENDEIFNPSPLVALYAPIDQSDDETFAEEKSFDDVPYETMLDEKGPSVDTDNYQTGTGALKDQAACPFRSFVQHRLKGKLPEELEPGSDPRIRGELVHRMMEDLWKQLKTSDRLHELNDEQLKELVNQSAEKILQQRAWRINSSHLVEQQRLVNVVMEWLAIEKQRQPFEVIGFEQETHFQINQLKLNMRIDRIDELADGSRCVIDYKTGEARSSQWVGERPDEPQVPLYALAQSEVVNAVAFAGIKAGESKYEGATRDRVLMAADERGLKGIKQIPVEKGASALKEYADWDGMLAVWKANLSELAAAYVNGDAAVDPKDGLATCRYCDVHSVCRLFAMTEDDGEDEEA